MKSRNFFLFSVFAFLVLCGPLSPSRTSGQTLPHISSFTPTNGTLGTKVTITGSGFTGATRVALDRVAASFSVDSDTQITARVAGGATTGTISVTRSPTHRSMLRCRPAPRPGPSA